MQKVLSVKNAVLGLFLIVLCGCVITSDKEIIRNDDATIMFGGHQDLLWIDHDNQEILLERLSGEKDRTYLAFALNDPAEATSVRFLEWPEFDLIPGERAYIIIAEIMSEKDRQTNWYYQLLTYDTIKNIWAGWSFDPPEGKERKVQNLEELKGVLKAMIENKHFKRRELIVFRAAGNNTHDRKSKE